MNQTNDKNLAEVKTLYSELQFAVQHNDSVNVIKTAEKLISLGEKNTELHYLIGKALPLLSELANAKEILEALLVAIPNAYYSRLIVGRFYELLAESNQAFKHYIAAIKAANSKGFWLNQASTVDWARPFVSHAMQFVSTHRQRVVREWLEPLAKQFGHTAMQRVRKAMLMYSGELPLSIADPRQSPAFLYIPDLPVSPVFPRELLGFIEEYEASCASIREEMHGLINGQQRFRPFQDDEYGELLTSGGDWNAYFFERHGVHYAEHHAQCPKTSTALSRLPLVNIADHAPEVCFSLMTPGTHILPHRGVTNSRAVLHLALDIPTECRLNLCGITEVEWQHGKAFAFDDTYLHEAWNRSNSDRIVLLADIWNPYLQPEERLALTKLIENIGILNNSDVNPIA